MNEESPKTLQKNLREAPEKKEKQNNHKSRIGHLEYAEKDWSNHIQEV